MGEAALAVDLASAHDLGCNAISVDCGFDFVCSSTAIARCDERCCHTNVLKVFSTLACLNILTEHAAKFRH